MRPRASASSSDRALLLVALALAAACSPPVKQYDIRRTDLSCDQANDATFRTMKAMGFNVGRFEPAAPGRDGSMHGVRERQPPDSGEQRAVVTIRCDPTGVSVDAREEGELLGGVDFKRPFYQSFTNIISMDAANRQMTEQIDAGTAPASQQRNDVQVLMEPIRGQEAKLDFGLDLAAAGVLPVRVSIANRTQRGYRLDPAEVRLTRADRERVAPMEVGAAAARVASAKTAAGMPPSETEARDVLARHLFAAKALEPGGHVSGYLYFPLADYLRGRIVLTERESEEDEGFLVEF